MAKKTERIMTDAQFEKLCEQVKEKCKSSKAEKNAQRSKDFLMILYPEDPKQVKVLEYIKQHEHIWQYAYILHDRDVWYEEDVQEWIEEHEGEKDAGDPPVIGSIKKPHYHVLIHRNDYSTEGGQSKFFGVKVKRCSNVEGSLLYFIHDTLASAHKAQYDQTELKGTQKLLDKVLIQKSHFVQLRYFLDLARKGIPFAEMVMRVEDDRNLSVEDKNEYLSFALSHGALLVMAGNQCQYIDNKLAQMAVKAYQQSAVGAEQLLRGDK